MGKTPHKCLIIHFEIKLDMFQIYPKFIEAKEHCVTLHSYAEYFLLLLSKCAGGESYWLAFIRKLLQQNSRNGTGTDISLKYKPLRKIGHAENRGINNG
jgi:hypothetical protein